MSLTTIIPLLAAAGTFQTAPVPKVPMAPRFDNLAPAVQVQMPIDRWWEAFGDPALDALVAETLLRNFTIAEANARLDRARAGIRAADGARMPAFAVDGSAGAAYLSALDPQLGAAQFLPGFDRGQDRYAASIGASWEVDLFGRLNARVRSARADAVASNWATEAARLAVTTEMAERYVTLRLLQQRRSIAQQRVGTLDRLAALAALRVERGISPPIERDRLIADARTATAIVPAFTAAIEDQFARIDVLAAREVGTARRELGTAAPLPLVREIDLAATPADLLRRRPDVRATEATLVARDAGVAAALRDRLPRFNLAGLIGTIAGAINPLFGAAAFTAQGSAGVTYTAFDGGRSRAAVEASRADVRGAASAYQRTVLSAVADVEAAGALRASATVRLRNLSEAESRLEGTFTAVGKAQSQGALSLTDLLDVERRLQDARDTKLIAEADQALASIALVRALGGGNSHAIEK